MPRTSWAEWKAVGGCRGSCKTLFFKKLSVQDYYCCWEDENKDKKELPAKL